MRCVHTNALINDERNTKLAQDERTSLHRVAVKILHSGCNPLRYIQGDKITQSRIFFTQFSHSITVTYTRIARAHNYFVETHFPFAANIRVKLFLNCKVGIFFA